MPESLPPMLVTVPADAEVHLRRMARSLDTMLQLAGGSARRYETATNGYETALEDAYATWVKALGRTLSTKRILTPDEQKLEIGKALTDLQRTLQELGQENLPDALYVLGHNYVPSPDAFALMAEVLRENAKYIVETLIPDLRTKLERAVDEGADVIAVAQSLVARVRNLAGTYWTTIQHAIGDFAAQSETADDEVYECRWVCEKDKGSCESCLTFAGEYPSYNAMLEATRQCVPGYFVNSPYNSCWANCRCYLELKIKGVWVRV